MLKAKQNIYLVLKKQKQKQKSKRWLIVWCCLHTFVLVFFVPFGAMVLDDGSLKSRSV
jgi:hypothetical protein